jgi:small nuclear ribonucleoprotein (snRNP)-like protein
MLSLLTNLIVKKIRVQEKNDEKLMGQWNKI